MEKNYWRISKEEINSGLDKALASYKIASLTLKDDKVSYDYIKSTQEIKWEYAPTVLPPKKFFFPSEEDILVYSGEGKAIPKIESFAQIIFGLRPCDIHALQILDQAFAEKNGDPNYLSKREKAILIGLDCKKVCSKDAFCFKVNTEYVETGFDLMLHETNDGYLLTIATEKGAQFKDKYLNATKIAKAGLEDFELEKAAEFKKYAPFPQLRELPEIFEKNKNHEVWKQEGGRCLSCGSCIMVCPTCYCFDVVDELDLSLKKGKRVRKWDACMLNDFAAVAAHENFRPKAENRLKHRINRKFNYLMKKHNQSACVGCGRCVRACLAGISPQTIVEKILNAGNNS